MSNPKLLRVSADADGRRSFDSKPCATLIEAMNDLSAKIRKFETTSGRKLTILRMVVGRRDTEEAKDFGIAKQFHGEARELSLELFHDMHVTLDDRGIS